MSPEDVDVGDEPLEYRPTTTSFPQISEEMVASLALGMEDDLVIAARHGFSVEQFLELAQKPFFQSQIASKRADFEKNGVTFRAKAAWMAGELLDKVYLMAADNNANFSQTHDALKTLIKAAGLEPKEDKNVAAGPTFQISIDLGAASVQLGHANQIQPVVLDAQVKELPEPDA